MELWNYIWEFASQHTSYVVVAIGSVALTAVFVLLGKIIDKKFKQKNLNETR